MRHSRLSQQSFSGNFFAFLAALCETNNTGGQTMIDFENVRPIDFDDETRHRRYMQMALLEAVTAFEESEVPVGAVIAHPGATSVVE